MSLKDGDALTVGNVISRTDFDKVVWDASKNEGGSFRFIPVQDAQGTALIVIPAISTCRIVQVKINWTTFAISWSVAKAEILKF